MSKISLGVFKFSNSFAKHQMDLAACIGQWVDTWQNPFWVMLFFLFYISISISIYSSVLRWWPVRTMVGLDLFLILSNYENPSGFLSHEGWNSDSLKAPHLATDCLSLSFPISCTCPSPHGPLVSGACRPHCHQRLFAQSLFPGMFPPPLTPGSPQWPTSSFHFHYCWKTSCSGRLI